MGDDDHHKETEGLTKAGPAAAAPSWRLNVSDFHIPERPKEPPFVTRVFLRSHGGFDLMAAIERIPPLKGDNYNEWKKKLDLAFVLSREDWVLTTPCPLQIKQPMRAADDDDAAWLKKQRDHAPLQMAHDCKKQQWVVSNKKLKAVIENTIDPTIMGSIQKCETASETLEKIKGQFHGSSKTYATQLIKQLMSEKYSFGGKGMRAHISNMAQLNNKLKPMDLNLKEEFLIHVIFASLPKEFESFVVHYNIQPEKWDLERCTAMCVQEDDRIRNNGGALNLVHNKKRTAQGKGNGIVQHQNQHQKQDKKPAGKTGCFHCGDEGHRKANCPDYLKYVMKCQGIPFDENYAKKRKNN